MHPTKESLIGLVDLARQRQVVLPEFQRSFIWERGAIEELLVSIFNEYFIGSLLTLDVSADSLPFRARAIEGIESDSHFRPQKMVLDGQQRITSIYYALYGPDINLKSTSYPYRFFLDANAAVDGRWDDAIVSMSTARQHVRPLFDDPAKQYESRYIGLNALRSWASWMQWFMAFQDFLKKRGDFDQQWANALLACAEKFLNYQVAVIELPQKTSMETVVEVFERINRTGTDLGIFELLTARLWNHGIQLRDLWDESVESHPRLAAVSVSKSDRYPKFILQAIALLRERECKRKDLILLDSQSFVEDWHRAAGTVESALKRMHTTASGGYGVVPALAPPYSTMVTPLAIMADHIESLSSDRGKAYEKLHYWYWSSVFRERYGGSTETISQRDFLQFKRWTEDDRAVPEAVPTLEKKIQRELSKVVRAGAVYRGILCLVALQGARDFFTGDTIELHRLDDHHIFPGSYLKSQGVPEGLRNSILNRTLISRDTNQRVIGAKNPSVYLTEIEHEMGKESARSILATHFIGDAAIQAMRDDDYRQFLVERERTLRAEIARRCVYSPIGAVVELEDSIAPGKEEERLDRLEEGLRDIIDETLYELAGEKYWKQLIPPDTRSSVCNRMDEQAALHPRAGGHQSPTHRTRLNYCDFSDYQQIVSQRNTWPAFETIFLRRGEFERHITSARRFRNALKHGRDIEPVERLAGHAGILWLENAIGQIRFSDRVAAEDEATVEDCLRVLTRRKVPDGQRLLFHSLVQAGPPGLTGEELVETMGRRDLVDLSGVLGALGKRVNHTPGYGESQKPGIGMLLDITQMDEGWHYSLKPIMLEALRQFAPSWLSRSDIDLAVTAGGTSSQGPSDQDAFREACAGRFKQFLDCELTKRSSALFVSDEENIAVVCLISKEYGSASRVGYWFAFQLSQKTRLEEVEKGYLALGCGSSDSVLLIPIKNLTPLLSEMNQTAPVDKKPYWHVQLQLERDRLILRRRGGSTPIDLNRYLI